MKFTPRPYQSQIIAHILRNPRCAVWAGMGMGKTAATLMALRTLSWIDDIGPVLVLAPLRVARSSWPDEAQKWDELSDLRISVIAGSAADRVEALNRKADIYTMNYENLPWLVKRYPDGAWPFRVIVADESTKLKGFRRHQGSQRAKALASVQCYVERFIELTGTPVPNGYEDLWGQFWFLDGGARLGSSMKAFHERWFRPVRVGANAFAVRWELLPGADKDIQKRADDLCIKLNPEDWFEIDKPIVRNVEVKLGSAAMTLYNELKRKFYVELDGGTVEASNAAALTGKLLQAAGGALYGYSDNPTDEPSENCFLANRYFTFSEEKLDALESIVNESGGEPVLVIYQFRHELKRIQERFPSKARVLDKTPQTIRDWNAGKIPVLLAHPASCGHGLSLQDGGRTLVFFTTNWNLEEHEQIIERIGPVRQAQSGHKRAVLIYNLIAKGTVDEIVQERIKTKREVLDLLLERRHA